MTATTVSQDLTPRTLDDTAPSVATPEKPSGSARLALAGKYYRFHGLRVLDADDRPVLPAPRHLKPFAVEQGSLRPRGTIYFWLADAEQTTD